MTYGPIVLSGDASSFGFRGEIQTTITGLGGKPLPEILTDGFLKYDATLQSWLTSNMVATASNVSFESSGTLFPEGTDNVQLALQNLDARIHTNAGVVVLPTLTDNGNGSVTIGNNGIYNLYSSHTTESLLKNYSINGNTFILTDNTTTYIYADYNNGSPVILASTNRDLISSVFLMTRTIIYTLDRTGNVITKRDWDSIGIALAEKALNRRFDVEGRFSRSISVGGLNISDTGSHNFSISSGRIWTPISYIDMATFNSQTDTCYQCVNTNGTWSTTAVTGYNYTQYNAASGLTALTANRYAVNWIWEYVCSTSKTVWIVLGNGDYKLAEAHASVAPAPPPSIPTIAVLVGRIIVEANADSYTQIDSAFEQTFGSSQVSIHNDLSGRDSTDCHPASSISYTPDGTLLTSLTVQEVIEEVASNITTQGDSRYHKLHGVYYENSLYEFTLSYNVTTRTLSIIPTGSDFRVWIKGIKYTFTGTQTIQHTTTGGGWFIYVNESGQLTASQTAWSILNHAPIAFIYYDPTTPDYKLLDERHHYNTDKEWHQSQHWSTGTFVRKGTDFVISGYTLNTATDIANTWALSSGTLIDEDIWVALSATSDGGPYQRHYKTGASGSWIKSDAVLPFLYSGTTSYIQYNQWTGSTWQLTDVPANSYVTYYIFGVTAYDPTKGIIVIPGQSTYSSLTAAQAENPLSLDLTDMFSQEYVPIYQIIYQAKGGDNNLGKCRTLSVTRLSGTKSSMSLGGTAATAHGSLSGRDASDQHPISAITFASTDNTNLIGISSIDHATTLNLGTTTADTINLGTSAETQTINIGTGSIASIINIGTVANVVNIPGLLSTPESVNSSASSTVSSPNSVVDSFSISTYRAAKYVISMSYSTSFHLTEVLVVHNGSDTFMTEYGTIMTGASLATISSTISGGNLQLTVTPVNASTSIKLVKTLIKV